MPLQPDDHLEPEEGFFGAPDFLLDYYSAVRRVLLPEQRRLLLQMVVLPSRHPEQSVYVLGGRRRPRDLTVVAGQVTTQIWGSASKHLFEPAKEGGGETFETISPEVKWARAPLGDDAFEHLMAAWMAALATARPRKALILDGVNFHFASGVQAARARSPRPGSACAELVALGGKLIDLAKLENVTQRAEKEAAVAADADQLVARFQQV
ncbi:MAG: hypothetical protein QM765_31600 [Myxococcales bacterium]